MSQSITLHSIHLSPRCIGYNEVDATNFEPLHYRVNDVKSPIHTVFHSCYLDLSVPKPPVCRSSLQATNLRVTTYNTLKI